MIGVHAIVVLSLVSVLADAQSDAAPKWTKAELMQMFLRAEQAVSLPPDAKDELLVDLAGYAYRTPRVAGERVGRYAERILKRRDPGHPRVKSERWLHALMRVFYDDIALRCSRVARFETDRRDRVILEAKGKEASEVARMLAAGLEIALRVSRQVRRPPSRAARRSRTGALRRRKARLVAVENLDRVR